MTAKTMAEVLAEHPDWAFDFEAECVCCIGCEWTQEVRSMDPAAEVFRTHQAAALSAAGFGLVADAKAEALEEAADELAKLQYVRPDQPGREEYERLLAIRRGETDLWLYTRARALKDPS